MAGMVCLILFDNDHLSHADHRILVSFIAVVVVDYCTILVVFVFVVNYHTIVVVVILDCWDGYSCC